MSPDRNKNEDLKSIMETALKLGADEVEIYAHNFISYETSIEKSKIKICNSSTATQLGIRLFKDHRMGFATTNSLNNSVITGLIRQALEIAENSPRDKNFGLPNPRKVKNISGLFDKKVTRLDIKDAIIHCRELIDNTKKIDKRISIDSGGFEIMNVNDRIVNSKGISLSYPSTFLIATIMEFAIEKDDIGSFQLGFDVAPSLKKMNLKKIIKETADKALAGLGAKKLNRSFSGPVLLSPFAAINLIISPITFSINSNAVLKGISYFKNKLNKKVADTSLTIFDDGTRPGMIGSAPWDREGVPHKKMNIINKGILKNFIYNTYTANKSGKKSTGHASGGASSVPHLGVTNLFIKPGQRTRKQLISRIDEGLIITRFSGNMDSVTGNFSGLVKGGFYVKGGKIKYPVKGIMVSGNSYECLNRIIGLSKEADKIFNYQIPHILVDQVRITSA